jgi:hypothetical protein
MYKTNKDVPPSVLVALQPYYKKQSELYYKSPSNPNYLLRFNDSDINSTFFFEISSYNMNLANGNISFNIAHAPLSYTLEIKKLTIDNKSLEEHFNMWVNNVSAYSTLLGPADNDLILKQYQKEFVSEFEMVDEDANTTSFDYHKQVLLDKYLDHVILVLEQAKTETNSEEIEQVKQNVIELKNNQTKLTKEVVVKTISKIWAKIRQIGLPILMLVKDEGLKELIKKGIEVGIKAYLTGG